MSDLDVALGQVARHYTLGLLDGIDPGDWLRMPAGGVTHVAWQVGHPAFAPYRLALERVRGKKPGDGDLISDELLRLFRRDSVPDPDPGKYPGPGECGPSSTASTSGC